METERKGKKRKGKRLLDFEPLVNSRLAAGFGLLSLPVRLVVSRITMGTSVTMHIGIGAAAAAAGERLRGILQDRC